MARTSFVVLCLFIFGLIINPTVQAANIQPDPGFTPGYLCTKNDPHFDRLAYAEKIAHCARSVSHAMKVQVAKKYNVPETDWKKYEFDHLIPLCVGGSNNIRNLWPQPLVQAKDKDKVEDRVCKGMAAGTMTQEAAVYKIKKWFASRGIFAFPTLE